MMLTGKRHDFRVDWSVGFDDTGGITGVEMTSGAALRLLGGLRAASWTAPCSTPITPIFSPNW